MMHYIAIVVPSEDGHWRVLFPDVAGCEGRGLDLHDAKLAALDALSRRAKQNGSELPPPRDLSAIEHDKAWIARNGIDLSRAIVTMVSLPT